MAAPVQAAPQNLGWRDFFSKETSIKQKLVILAKKIWSAVKIVFIAVTSILLYLANPSIFALGFLVGFIFDKKVRETADRAKEFCLTKPWIVPIIVVGSFLALPVAIASCSFVSGAYLSSQLAGTVTVDVNKT